MEGNYKSEKADLCVALVDCTTVWSRSRHEKVVLVVFWLGNLLPMLIVTFLVYPNAR